MGLPVADSECPWHQGRGDGGGGERDTEKGWLLMDVP